jgi:hypothetical protein
MHGLPVAAGMPGAPDCLAIHGHRPPPAPPMPPALASGPQPQPRFQPGTHRRVEGHGINGFQDPADGGLIRRLEPPGQRIKAHPKSSEDLRWGIRGPLADGRERPRPSQHRRHGRQ